MRLELGRRGRAQAPFVAVLAIVVADFVLLSISPGHWRLGAALLALAMLVAALLRVVLPARHAGMLVVRGRWWDSFCYVALSVAILIFDIRLRN